MYAFFLLEVESQMQCTEDNTASGEVYMCIYVDSTPMTPQDMSLSLLSSSKKDPHTRHYALQRRILERALIQSP